MSFRYSPARYLPATPPSGTTSTTTIAPKPPKFVSKRKGKGTFCFVKRLEYVGTPLTNIPNGANNKQKNKKKCQKSCRRTPGCEYWTFVGKRAEIDPRSCTLFSRKSGQINRNQRVSGPRKCSETDNDLVESDELPFVELVDCSGLEIRSRGHDKCLVITFGTFQQM